jgi:hypothetical protein
VSALFNIVPDHVHNKQLYYSQNARMKCHPLHTDNIERFVPSPLNASIKTHRKRKAICFGRKWVWNVPIPFKVDQQTRTWLPKSCKSTCAGNQRKHVVYYMCQMMQKLIISLSMQYMQMRLSVLTEFA